MFKKISQSSGIKLAVKLLLVFLLLILVELNFMFGTNIGRVSAVLNEQPGPANVDAGLFDFQVEYMGRVGDRRLIGTSLNGTPNKFCQPLEHTFNLGNFDYFIVKMEPGNNSYGHPTNFDFVNFGPRDRNGYPDTTANNNRYWNTTQSTNWAWRTGISCNDGDNKKTVCGPNNNTACPPNTSIAGGVQPLNNPPRILVRPHTAWCGHPTNNCPGDGWRVWRVKVNSQGYPAITAKAFLQHNGVTVDNGVVEEGCKVSYMMLDDDPATASDARMQKWHIKNMGTGQIVQTVNVPDGMIVGKSFFVRDDLPGTPNLHLLLEAQDSIAMLHVENCDEEEFSWQIKMKGVFIATAQREREGVGESGFKFERSINVPPGVAPLLIEYDPKYLIEFASLLGEALVDWVEIPN